MNDVLPESGGFLIVRINGQGIIGSPSQGHSVVHRETRDLHLDPRCIPSLVEAKTWLQALDGDGVVILELTPEGGGSHIWMREEQKELLVPRLDRYKGCYGGWPIRTLSI